MWLKNAFWCTLMMIVFLAIFGSFATADWMFASTANDFKTSLAEGEKCQIKIGELGICKRLTSCEIYHDGLKQKSIPYSFLVGCSFMELDEVICCPLDEYSSINSEESKISIGTLSGTRPPYNRTLTVPRPTQGSGLERPSQAACRKYSGGVLGLHIIDGHSVAPGEYPHMGGLIIPNGGGPQIDNRCGSILISERYVLTAAHCVSDPLALPTFVRFGVTVWNTTGDDPDGDGNDPVDVEFENIIIHSEYKSDMRYHDIALIKLRNNVEFSAFVRPACLYSDPEDIDSNTPLVVIGWGVTNVESRMRSKNLLQANVTTVPLQECNATHIAYGLSRSYRKALIDGHYCAFDPELKYSPCAKDSGGPLQLVRNKESTIVGIISFGLGCDGAIPSVYTRVAHYLDWIESIVWPS